MLASYLLLALLAGCNSQAKPTHTKPTLIVDIPSLIGKSYKQIQGKLGKPTENTKPTDAARKAGIWSNSWWFDNGLLAVEYRLDNYKVINFFLATSESAYGTKNKTSLLKAGNLKENDPRYTLQFVKAKNTTDEYTGIFIILK